MKKLTMLLSCTAGVAISTACFAQESSRAAVAQDQASSQPTPQDDAVQTGNADIVVTGSRVSNPNIIAPTPVTAVSSTELFQSSPANIADALNQLPAFRGSNNVRNQQVGSGPVQGNYLNLRNLGPNRTLVLFDGMRVLPTNAIGGVDSNILPQLLIERVDVVTGGASAAYGSDAVAGVVNFVIDKDYEGIKGVAQRGVSTYGDVPSYRVGIAAGKSFADDKLHVVASYERYKIDSLSAADRPNYDDLYLFTGTGTAANPFTLSSNVRFNTVTTGGIIRGGPLNNTVFLGNGQTKIYSGTATGTSNLSIGGDGVAWQPADAASSLQTDQAFGRVQYDLSPAVSFHAQFSWARSKNQTVSVSDYRFPGSGAQLTLFSGNPYLPTSVQTAMTNQNIPSVVVGRASIEIPPFIVDVTNNAGIINTGFEGQFDIGSRTASWDVSYVRGRSASRNDGVDSSNVRFFAAIDAVRDSSGNIVCRVTITNPGLYPGCVPANIVGPGSLSQAAVDYIRNETHWAIRNKLDIVAANLRTDLFDLPGGPLSVAIGAEGRWQSLEQTSDSDPAIPIASISQGIRGVPATATINRTTIAGVASGSLNVKEGYIEVAAPLLRDLPLIHSLDLNGAIRYTDYSTSGSVTTWKVGGVYRPFEDLRLRATLSRDIAAPTLFQLFSGAQIVTGAINDPHIGLSTQVQQVTQGNPDLSPERATTLVLGGVYSPSWLPGFNVSVDYYKIKIEDAITTRSGTQALQDCEASNGTAPVCALIIRPLPFSDRTPANAVSRINLIPLNRASLKQSGIDIEANFSRPLEGIGIDGRLVLRANVNVLLEASTQLTSVSPNLDAVGTGFANQKVRGTFSQGFESDRVSLQISERYIGPSKVSPPLAVPLVFANYGTYKSAFYVDFSGSVKVGPNKELELFLNVENLFNKKPPLNGPVSNDIPSTNPGLFIPTGYQYDIFGRYYTAGVRFSF